MATVSECQKQAQEILASFEINMGLLELLKTEMEEQQSVAAQHKYPQETMCAVVATEIQLTIGSLQSTIAAADNLVTGFDQFFQSPST